MNGRKYKKNVEVKKSFKTFKIRSQFLYYWSLQFQTTENADNKRENAKNGMKKKGIQQISTKSVDVLSKLECYATISKFAVQYEKQ